MPLFLSRRRLAGRKTLPRARGPWALDSGGYTELSTFGRWTVTVDQYIREVREYASQIGNLRFAVSMDWMCEPWIVAKTGLTVEGSGQNGFVQESGKDVPVLISPGLDVIEAVIALRDDEE